MARARGDSSYVVESWRLACKRHSGPRWRLATGDRAARACSLARASGCPVPSRQPSTILDCPRTSESLQITRSRASTRKFAIARDRDRRCVYAKRPRARASAREKLSFSFSRRVRGSSVSSQVLKTTRDCSRLNTAPRRAAPARSRQVSGTDQRSPSRDPQIEPSSDDSSGEEEGRSGAERSRAERSGAEQSRARTYTHASGEIRHWRLSAAGLRPGEKNSRDAEAIADGDESFPLNGLPRVDLHLLSTQEAG